MEIFKINSQTEQANEDFHSDTFAIGELPIRKLFSTEINFGDLTPFGTSQISYI